MEDIAFPCTKCKKNMIVIERRLSSASLIISLKNARFSVRANQPAISCGNCGQAVAAAGFKML